MDKRNIALGFYQEVATANAVISELKRRNFCRFAKIHRQHDNTLEINRYFPWSVVFASLLCALAIAALYHFGFSPLYSVIIVGITAIYDIWKLSKLIPNSIVNRLKNRVIIDEILIVAVVKPKEIREVLTILRQVKSGHPMTFLLRPALFEEVKFEIPAEPLTIEQLREEASRLTLSVQRSGTGPGNNLSLMRRFNKSSEQLQFLRNDLADAEFIEQKVLSSAEWLLDNMYVLEGNIEDVKLNLPKKYYQELPKILNGPLEGLPRIYALATELVKNTVGGLNRENITNFLEAYQIEHPLTIGELWAFPLMLRLRVIEWVEFLANRVDNRMREGELASYIGNRLLYTSRHDPTLLQKFLSDLSKEQAVVSGHFAEELLDHLFDEEALLPIVRNWLEERFGSSLDAIIHQEHLDETFEQVVFSNLIRSLITLQQLAWKDIFESVSCVDAVLKEDQSDIFSQMDFTTRNAYRSVIERIGRRVKVDEVQIAKHAVALAKEGKTPFDKHIGYYLIDNGKEALEQTVGYRPNLMESIRRWILRNPASVYIGGITALTLAFEYGMYHFARVANLPDIETIFILALSLIPLSELSVQLVNLILTLVLRTPLRPKMSYDNGIPAEFKTLVVVPMMLLNPESIREEIQRLEIRYLANTDPELRFGLFSDFIDSKEHFLENDSELLSLAIEGLKALDKKYGGGIFFLFHRNRVWSKCENRWIGWERKRGKLEWLNRYLMGMELPENIVYFGNSDELKGIRYVITLDADTQLPKDQARAMVEVLSHPLNRAYLSQDNKKVERGFTLIQPRVGTDFIDAKASWFSMIFAEPTAVDPYTQAISNIYQDLTGEGSYHGKGIYDVATFNTLLSNYFPEEHLLSHDLLEGSYIRVGFSSNICLFDAHPRDYLTWAKRQQRWIRGDWQIVDWLKKKVPVANGQEEPNPLSTMNRWKIFDNLRRAVMPIALLLLLTLGWTMTSIPAILTGLGLIILLLPSITLCIAKLFTYSFAAWNLFLSELKILTIRSFITIALLPFEAYLSLDAMVRVGYRRLISHRHLLQWTSFQAISSDARSHSRFLIRLSFVSIFAMCVLTIVHIWNPTAVLFALPFCLLWLVAPIVVYFLDRPLDKSTNEEFSDADRLMLRKIARKTWRYFDELVGPSTHWLPPDNYQTALNIEIAQRTSPTNIGMWIVAVMNAYDFKYINCDIVIDKTLATIHELKKLERHEGHFLNWYNIQTLEPLFPRYVSTVDSGNFIASLWTLKQGLMDMLDAPIIPPGAMQGVKDAYEILKESNAALNFIPIERLFTMEAADNLATFILAIKDALKIFQDPLVEYLDLYWRKQLEEQLQEWDSLLSRYFSWVGVLNSITKEQLETLDPQAPYWKDQALVWIPSLAMLKTNKILPAFELLIKASEKKELSNEMKAWGKRLKESLSTASWFAGEKAGLALELTQEIENISQEMNLGFLYNDDRKLFAIGYNVDDKKIDTSYYDLLASEARIASLVAIAKEDVPLEHWWSLGRIYSVVQGKKVLMSWGGTMFEYLMPLIFNKQYSDSLLGEACNAAVACQIAYGNSRGIPWGISESAFSGIDSNKIYQYRSFGVPGLGLKRGLEDDLVISPYSTALALAVKPSAAMTNLKKMSEKNPLNMTGAYGFYESMDFTRQRSPTGERGVVVYVYMAHHQGMIFATINNVLNQDKISKRFHQDPRISGVNSILYERIPYSRPIKITSVRKEPTMRRLEPFSQSPIMGVVETPESLTPKVNLLSNEKYSLMITNAGGGYSRWEDIDIYRWRADTTRDNWGNFCYIKDVKSGDVWSTTYQPTITNSKEYSATFKTDKAEFRRKDHQIEAITEVVVSPEDNAEIRLITLINHSNETRHIELTSYLELCLAPHLADRAHPCFNKLFIETEALPEDSALLGFRRLRSPEEVPIWAIHVVSVGSPTDGDIQYETDRNKFVGRGNKLTRPAALDQILSNSTGTVLDPIFSLRRRVIIEPGKRVQLSFVTAITHDRASAITLIDKYKNITASHRALELAWNYAQLDLRHLRIHQEEVQLFQKLASRLIYPHLQLRTVADRLLKNRMNQSGLWAQGISGDFPIMVVTVGDVYDIDLVKQLLIAHSFLSMRGLKSDLVILNEEASGYMQPLNDQLQSLIQAYSYRNQVDQPGGVFARTVDHLPAEELNLILAAARAVFVASRGSLRQQLVSPKSRIKLPKKLIVNEKIKEGPSKELPFLELPYFNGLGGFSQDGSAYVIYLGPNKSTPAPWINVIANPQFGTLVSESGIGCTWFGNSQTNRLTPWSNDPLLDPITDAIYIRDEELGIVWTPTPSPVRELDAYRISHHQGYTRFEHNSHEIEQELLVYVPVDDAGGLPLRVQRLRLTNRSTRRRKLSLTAYSEWILGNDKEETQMHVITEWDAESEALFGYNRYNPDFGNYVAFSASSMPIASYTGDRTEFIGRNRSTSSPEALTRQSLSGTTGAALDPCSALQGIVEIDPGKEVIILFVMGYAPDADTAKQLIAKSVNLKENEKLFSDTTAWWNKTLSTIQVETPDMATNFMLNRWLIYQDLSCRFWGRSAFYQSSGAYGFRDQLQDCLSLVYSVPTLARDYILKAASHQFLEGDVQHWWHPQTNFGIRTRCSDDFLWLPYVTAQYIRVTGDKSILNEEVHFLEGDLLEEHQQEHGQVPIISKEKASLIEHCRRAVERGMTQGAHGLPLIGSCDWNDGMNRVGLLGKGESVWLGWFFIHVLNDYAELLTDKKSAEEYRNKAKRLAEVIEATSWDGEWYRRAYFDDGSPLGSSKNSEATIDSLTQSWAVISGLANPERSARGLKSALEYLVNTKNNFVKLLTPPFDKTPLDPGYIKGYPPGVRENGGQYTHGSAWLAMAFARRGDGDKAVELLRMMSPTLHTQTVEATELYKVEPYVIVADIYDLKGQEGRGGWSWYTGSAGWIYKIWLEEILGFKLRGSTLFIDCTIPKAWEQFKIIYRYKSTPYTIVVKNPNHVGRGEYKIDLVDDGKEHVVEVTLS